MNGKNFIIIAATSTIAEAVAIQLASKGSSLYLVGRNESELQSICNDLKIKNSNSDQNFFYKSGDLEQDSFCYEISKDSLENFNKIDGIFLANGYMPNQKLSERCEIELSRSIVINSLSSIRILNSFIPYFEKNGGTVAAITSVAGDRGRSSNYLYGASKSMLSVFLQGYRSRLSKFNVNVIDFKLGFVRTKMTRNLNTSGLLWSDPDFIAKKIIYKLKKTNDTVYLPWFWKFIMLIIRFIPEKIFLKVKI